MQGIDCIVFLLSSVLSKLTSRNIKVKCDTYTHTHTLNDSREGAAGRNIRLIG